ncbi:hypothetical protein K0M31_020287 [Melipona bicolor]|uniref:Uncharacterized protein n=1 Tax=Melipona bicolor TaxID=60889 RepID=A0AA40G1S0_9HYME|nr:hypothetical protein K0M31_020287 [Melipona bicolor]
MAPGRILEAIQELGGEEFLPPVGENGHGTGDGNGAAYRPLVWGPNQALTHIHGPILFLEENPQGEESCLKGRSTRRRRRRTIAPYPPSDVRVSCLVGSQKQHEWPRTMETVKQKDGFVGSEKRGVPGTYERGRPVNASPCNKYTGDDYRTRFEGETIIIMIILELEGRRPAANKLRGLLAACAPHSGIGAFDRSVSDRSVLDRERHHHSCWLPQFFIGINTTMVNARIYARLKPALSTEHKYIHTLVITSADKFATSQ